MPHEVDVVCDPSVSQGNQARRGAPYRSTGGMHLDIGERVEVAPLHRSGRVATAFSPDSKLLAFGAAEALCIWNIAEGRPEEMHQVDIRITGWMSWLAFSPDGTLLAIGCQDHTVRLLELDSGSQRMLRKKKSGVAHAFRGDADYAERIAFSRDGKLIAAGHEGQAVVWDVASGEEVARLGESLLSLRNVAFGTDDLLACGTSPVELWRIHANTTELLLTIDPPTLVWALDLSPDGKRLVTGDGQSQVLVWDTNSGEQICQGRGHGGDVEAVTFAPNGEAVASYAKDGTIRFWSARSGAQLARIESIDDDAHAVSVSPDGKWLASGGLDKSVGLWPLRWSVGRGPVISQAARTPRCQLDVGPPRVLETFESNAQQAAFTPDSQQLLATGGRALKRWALPGSDGDPSAKVVELAETRFEDRAIGLAVHPDGKRLALACDDGTVRLHELTPDDNVTGSVERKRLRKHSLFGRLVLRRRDDTPGLCFVGDGETLAATCGGKVVLWNLSSGRRRRLGASHLEMERVVSHGSVLAAGCASAYVWDLGRGQQQPIHELDPANSGLVWDLAISANGRLLATGDSNARMCLWDLETGAELRRHEGHGGDVYAVAFDPLGEVVASYDENGMIRLWCLENGGLVTRFEQGSRGRPVSLSFSPDGQWLAAGPYGSALTLWPIGR